LVKADKLFSDKSYLLAKTEYTNAGTIKPAEQYPKDKVLEIDGILAELKAKDDAYKASITKANQFLAQKSYEDARTEYQNASSIKPLEQFPKDKIAEINKLLTDIKGKKQTYDDLIVKGNDYFGGKDYYKAKETYQQASLIFPEEAYPKDRLSRIGAVLDSMYRANKGLYDKAIADADKFYTSMIYDKAIDSYTDASAYLPMETYPREMISKIKKTIAENAIVDVLKSTVVIAKDVDKQFSFSPVNMASRKNNYVYVKIRNLSDKPFNVLIRYGKDKQTNGGAVIKNLAADGKASDRLISVRDQDPWYREDNNWVSLFPQGGDVEVTFIQISRATQ
jgi:tetratricopeptide (TPR) repeat protein